MLDHGIRKTGNNPKTTRGTGQLGFLSPAEGMYGHSLFLWFWSKNINRNSGMFMEPLPEPKASPAGTGSCTQQIQTSWPFSTQPPWCPSCPFSWGMCFCNAVSGNAFLGDLNSSHQSWKDDFYQGVSLTGWVSVRHRWCVRAFGPVTS